MANLSSSTQSKVKRVESDQNMALEPINYWLIGLGVFIIALAFTLMAVEDEVDGFLSLWIAPYMLVFGYAELVFAILYQKKRSV